MPVRPEMSPMRWSNPSAPSARNRATVETIVVKPGADHPRQSGGVQSRPRVIRSQTLIAGECCRSGYGGTGSAPQGGCGPALPAAAPKRTAGQQAIKATAKAASERVVVTDSTLAPAIQSAAQPRWAAYSVRVVLGRPPSS